MGLLIFSETFNDLSVTYTTTFAAGTAQASGIAVSMEIRFRNTAEYTVRGNPTQAAEYRHLPTNTDRDRTHRR